MTETKAASTDVAPKQPAIFTHFDRPIEYLSDALHYGGFCGLGEFCFLDRDIDINMLCTAIADTSETEGLSEEGLNKAKEAHAMLSLLQAYHARKSALWIPSEASILPAAPLDAKFAQVDDKERPFVLTRGKPEPDHLNERSLSLRFRDADYTFWVPDRKTGLLEYVITNRKRPEEFAKSKFQRTIRWTVDKCDPLGSNQTSDGPTHGILTLLGLPRFIECPYCVVTDSDSDSDDGGDDDQDERSASTGEAKRGPDSLSLAPNSADHGTKRKRPSKDDKSERDRLSKRRKTVTDAASGSNEQKRNRLAQDALVEEMSKTQPSVRVMTLSLCGFEENAHKSRFVYLPLMKAHLQTCHPQVTRAHVIEELYRQFASDPSEVFENCITSDVDCTHDSFFDMLRSFTDQLVGFGLVDFKSPLVTYLRQVYARTTGLDLRVFQDALAAVSSAPLDDGMLSDFKRPTADVKQVRAAFETWAREDGTSLDDSDRAEWLASVFFFWLGPFSKKDDGDEGTKGYATFADKADWIVARHGKMQLAAGSV